MSLLKRGSVWWSYFYVDGIRHQSSTGTGNKRQAESIEQKLKEEINARRFQIVKYDPDITVAALCARFMADPGYRRHHYFHIKAILPFFGDMQVIRLHRNHATEFRAWRMSRKKLTDATVNRSLSTLRHILYWAVDEQLIQANPLTRLRLVKERRLRRPVMTLSEEGRVLDALPDYLRRIVICALDTGMRRGEVLRQRWEDVDLVRKLLMVTKSKTIEGEGREIPLTARLYRILAKDTDRDGIVFTMRGQPLSWIRKGWLGALKRAELRHFRIHDLRHTFNTRLMEAGVIQDVRMALMGHSGGSRVHSTYTHVEFPVKREAIARLQKWVSKQRKEPQGGSENASTENARPNVGQDDNTGGSPDSRAQTMEEKDASGSGVRTGRKAQGGNRRGRGRPEKQTASA
ncbi:MAG TPA: tyrosine-type recombinase/integrase [Bryobacteraceae bacterium]|nr:tyrosine-type recombinase/integrase [Bryobacteraceae bacterium]